MRQTAAIAPALAVAALLSASASAAVAECIPTVLPIAVCPGDGAPPFVEHIHPSQGGMSTIIALTPDLSVTDSMAIWVKALRSDAIAEYGDSTATPFSTAAEWEAWMGDALPAREWGVTGSVAVDHAGLAGYAVTAVRSDVPATGRFAAFDAPGGMLMIDVIMLGDFPAEVTRIWMDAALSTVRPED